MALEFSADSEAKIKNALEEYHDRQAALIPVLYIALDQFGALTPEIYDLVAGRLEQPRMFVEAVATFYTMLYKKPVGRHHIQVCRTLICAMAGAPRILEHITEKLGIKPGETTPDGKFSLEEVECLAMCGSGPAMIINKTNYENLTVEKIEEILDGLD